MPANDFFFCSLVIYVYCRMYLEIKLLLFGNLYDAAVFSEREREKKKREREVTWYNVDGDDSMALGLLTNLATIKLVQDKLIHIKKWPV